MDFTLSTQRALKKYLSRRIFIRKMVKKIYFILLVLRIFVKHHFSVKSVNSDADAYIFGWYGTETVGDKLILAGILYELFHASQEQLNVVVCSMDPVFTKTTLEAISNLYLEKGFPKISSWIENNCAVSDQISVYGAAPSAKIILGGGPIMEDPEIVKWALVSKYLARVRKSKIIIFGCGVGPVHSKFLQYWIRMLFSNASYIVCRNYHPSLDGFKYEIALDPSFIMLRVLAPKSGESRSATLGYNARAIPYQYAPDEKLIDEKYIYNQAKRLSAFVSEKNIKKIYAFSTHQMDSYTDLEVMRDVLKHVTMPVDVVYLEDDMATIINALIECKYVMSTRYHGFILGILLSCRSFGGDYAKEGGKISQLYESLGWPVPDANAFNGVAVCDADLIDLGDKNALDRLDAALRVYRQLSNNMFS